MRTAAVVSLCELCLVLLPCLRDESDAFRSTAARRQELEKRAADKAAAEAERLKEQERAARQQERHNQVCQLLDIEQQVSSSWVPVGQSTV